ncbi:unnamed protein product [Calypogeia fissa]
MSETYDSYERQYFELSDKISRKCVSSALATGEEKKQMLVEIKNGLDEAESLIRRMDLEARNLPPTQKATLLAGLRSHKADLTNLKREAKKTLATRDGFAARDELLEGGMADSDTLSADQRARLLTATERLNQSGDRIKDSKRTLLETESLGVSILADLHSQRQTLLHARDTMNDVDDNVGKSRRILISMTRLMNRNKLIGWGLIITLIFVILVVLYFKFKW